MVRGSSFQVVAPAFGDSLFGIIRKKDARSSGKSINCKVDVCISNRSDQLGGYMGRKRYKQCPGFWIKP
jgi:hypothetical protein